MSGLFKSEVREGSPSIGKTYFQNSVRENDREDLPLTDFEKRSTEPFELKESLELSKHAVDQLWTAKKPIQIAFPVSGGQWREAVFDKWKSLGDQGTDAQWLGTVKGDPHSRVIVTRWKKALYGMVSTQGEQYEWNGLDGGAISVHLLDPLTMPGCEVGEEVDSDGTSDRQLTPIFSDADTLSEVPVSTIVIGYSSEAALQVGGVSILEAKILSGVALANSAFADSNIHMKLAIAWLGGINVNENPNLAFAQYLQQTYDPIDGFADELPALKARYKADFACLWLHSNVSGGRAYVLTSSNPDRAYSLVRSKNGLDTFVHELGHNMGCRHLRETYSSTPSSWYTDSFANFFITPTNARYVTVMASNGDARDKNATRIAYFSNPNVSYQGAATGTTGAFAARTLQLNASIYGDFEPQPPMTASIIVSDDNLIRLTYGFVGESYLLQKSSPGLSNWMPLTTLEADNSGGQYTIDNASAPVFYRWVSVE